MTERAPVWLPPFSLTTMAVIIALLSLVLPIGPLLRIVGQLFLLMILLRAFCYWPPLARWTGTMPWLHRLVLVFLLGGMVVGHYTLQTHRFFPFVVWAIFPFVQEDDPVTCREFLATTASGKSVRLLAEQIFPSIVQFNPPLDNESPAMAHLVQALARGYDLRHAGDPVRGVDLVRVAVKLHPAPNEAPTSCELLKHYDVSSDRSN